MFKCIYFKLNKIKI